MHILFSLISLQGPNLCVKYKHKYAKYFRNVKTKIL